MKFTTWHFAVVAFFGLTVFTACTEKTAAEKAEDKIENTTEEIGDLFRTEQEELQHDLNEIAEDIDEKMTDLKSELAEASDETKAEINEQLAKLEASRKEIGQDLDRLGDQVADNWNDFKQDVNNRIDAIQKEL